MSHIERTLVLFKPDAVQRGVVGELLTRFERVGLKNCWYQNDCS